MPKKIYLEFPNSTSKPTFLNVWGLSFKPKYKLALGQAQLPCTYICVYVFSFAMRMQMQEASPVVTLNWSAGWKTKQKLQQTLHNIDLCREYAMWIRDPSLTDLVR
jgi:hypothetical protein